MEALVEQVIEHQRRSTSSIHETFRAMPPVPSFIIVLLKTRKSQIPAPPQCVSCGEDDNRPMFRFAHIPPHNYSETMFTKNYFRWNNNLAWSWGKYGEMGEQALAWPCLCQVSNPTESFQQFDEQHQTALSMDFYNARFVEVPERGYTLLGDFPDLTNQRFFNDVEFSFHQSVDRELADSLISSGHFLQPLTERNL